MRQCPSVEGSASPLITHRIGVDVCFARQRTFFHKCHRCIYRGQAADWEPAEAPMAMINVHAAEEPVQAGVKPVQVPRPATAEPAPRRAAPSRNGHAQKPAGKGAAAKNGAAGTAAAKNAAAGT